MDTAGVAMEVDVMEVLERVAPFTMEYQDSEADTLRVTGRMATTIPIQTTVCAKDGFQQAAITRKVDRTQTLALGIQLRFRTGIGKMFPAINPTTSNYGDCCFFGDMDGIQKEDHSRLVPG